LRYVSCLAACPPLLEPFRSLYAWPHACLHPQTYPSALFVGLLWHSLHPFLDTCSLFSLPPPNPHQVGLVSTPCLTAPAPPPCPPSPPPQHAHAGQHHAPGCAQHPPLMG
jgi:hypothetical protein